MSNTQKPEKPVDLVDMRIERLNEPRAIFCLKALMLAGHVSREHMGAVLALADTVRFPDEY